MIKEIKVFDLKINPLSRLEFLSVITSQLKKRSQIVQNGINASSIIESTKNEEFINALNNSDLVNIDGMSVVWALRFFGIKIPERVACPDLALDILRMAESEHYSVFLLGATEKNILLCRKKLVSMFPELIIAGCHHGYYPAGGEEEIIEKINSVDPDILFLGMPSPKKEFFVDRYRSILSVRYSLGVGGFFDVIAGIRKRAPEWIQYLGLEWLFRLSQDPVKLWKRYMVGNFKFIRLVLSWKLNTKMANK